MVESQHKHTPSSIQTFRSLRNRQLRAAIFKTYSQLFFCHAI